jgi:hypothetical protein
MLRKLHDPSYKREEKEEKQVDIEGEDEKEKRFNPKTDINEWDGNGPQVGGHAIELVGWGNRNCVDYWIVKNSWGVEWGMNGYFYMKRGVNM